jgi:hypothetical protein
MAEEKQRNIDEISRPAEEDRSEDEYRREGEEFHESLAYSGTYSAMTAPVSMVAPTILLVVSGLWLIVAPFALNYPTGSPGVWNDVILGAVVAIVALANSGIRAGWLSWVNFLLGVWLIVAPFVLTYHSVAGAWNDVLTGVLVCLFAAWASASITDEEGQQQFNY